MTAILTKQNVLDKAFIGGNGSGKGGDGEFDALHVKGKATIDGDCKVFINDEFDGPQSVGGCFQSLGQR